MGYSSEASGAARTPQPLPENYHVSKTKGKQNEPLPTPIEILSKTDTVPPGSNSIQLRENHQIVSKDADSTTESEEQINELGKSTLATESVNGDFQELSTTSSSEIDAQQQSELEDFSEEELALMAKMEAFKKAMEERNAFLDNEEAMAENEEALADSKEIQGQEEKTLENARGVDVLNSLNLTAEDYENCFVLPFDDPSAERATKFDDKDSEAMHRFMENSDNIVVVKEGVLHISPSTLAKVNERGIDLKKWINVPFNKIEVMSKEQMAELKASIKQHINRLNAAPSSEPEVEEEKVHEEKSAKPKGEGHVELEEHRRKLEKEAQEAKVNAPHTYHLPNSRLPELVSSRRISDETELKY